jgi:GNAT superfamily N-acetyltransferase
VIDDVDAHERTVSRSGPIGPGATGFVAAADDGAVVGRLARRVAVADGWAAFTGPGLFANRVPGAGLADGAVAGPEHFALLEDFAAAHDLAPEAELCPLADASWWRLAGQRGYRLQGFRNVYVRATLDPRPVAPAADIAVVTVDEATFGTWSTVLLDGFGYDDGSSRRGVARRNRMLLGCPQASLLLASLDGEPVGASNLLVHGTVAALGGTTTLMQHRRRGVQRALLTARLAVARDAGCTLAVVTADPGATSARNIERHGFRLAYTNARLRRGATGPA